MSDDYKIAKEVFATLWPEEDVMFFDYLRQQKGNFLDMARPIYLKATYRQTEMHVRQAQAIAKNWTP